MNTIISLFTFVLNIALGVRYWALSNHGEAMIGLALIGALATEVLALWIVRTGVLSNYRLWKREKDTWNESRAQHVYGEWKLVRGLFRFWQMGLTIRWTSLGIWPEFSYRWIEWVDWRGMKRPILRSESLYGTSEIDWSTGRPFNANNRDWSKDEVEYILSHREWRYTWENAIRANWTPLMRVLWGWGWMTLVIFAIVGFILGPLPWLAGFFVQTSATTPASTATQIAVAPTSAPRPTATPELEVEVTDSGTAIVIDLDQQAPASALLEWINGLPGPNLPALPSALEDWLNSLPWPEVAAIQLPEGMDGYVVVARRGDGFELVRLDENGNLVGNPVALKDTKEFTLHARELKWGVRYSSKFRVTNESQGHIDVYVAESGEPSMAVGYHLYNFRWWHWLIWLIVGILGIIAAYQIGKRY